MPASFFNYAYKQGLIDRPIVFGDGFKKPSQRVLRCERQKKGKKMFTAKQIRAMIGKAGPQLKAMILLGINCGMGNHDCAILPMSILDLKTGWLDFGRPKTGIERRCRLWPETIAALTGVLTRRREPKESPRRQRVHYQVWLSLDAQSQDWRLPNQQGNRQAAKGTKDSSAGAGVLHATPHF